MFSSYYCIKCKSKDLVSSQYVSWIVCNKCGHEFTKKEFVENEEE